MMIVQDKALKAIAELQPMLSRVRRVNRSLFLQLRSAAESVVLNLAEARGNDPGTGRARYATACGSAHEVRACLQLARVQGAVDVERAAAVDALLDEVCAMSWRLSGR